MRQRNDTGRELVVHTDPPQVVPDGGEIDHDTYVVGFTVLDEPGPADEPATKKPAKTAAKEATS